MLKYLYAALGFCLLFWPTQGSGQPGPRPIHIQQTKVVLDPANPETTRVGKLRYRGGLELQSSDKSFGGFSGLIIDQQGSRITAATDRGSWLSAKLSYKNGDLAVFSDARMAPMLGPEGKPLSGATGDAEGLASMVGGGILASFEQHHRLLYYAPTSELFNTIPVELARPEGLSNAPANKGLEAVTLLDTGQMFLLTEDHRDEELDAVGWIMDQPLNPTMSTAQPISLAVSGLFRPTGATTLPVGDIIVLERRYMAVQGGSMRLRRIPKGDLNSHARLTGTILATVVPPLTVDNMEAVAVRSDQDGGVFVYVMSDDNFSTETGSLLLPAQRTLLMMFQLEVE